MKNLPRLQRLESGCESIVEALKVRMMRLTSLKSSREDEAVAIGRALGDPLVASLPMFGLGVRRLHELDGELTLLCHDMADIRARLLKAESRAALIRELATRHVDARRVAYEARELQEVLGSLGAYSLPQDSRD